MDPMLGWLSVIFFLIAILYASVGFGGGSSYTAMLALFGVSVGWIPLLSLSCNIVVVAGGCWHFYKRGYLNPRFVGSFLVGSVPMAFLAGTVEIASGVYIKLLALSLFAAALMLLLRPRVGDGDVRVCPLPVRLLVGGGLGALSGLVGIGGGIFLAPILLLARWASPKECAATASGFILFNSFAGLAGQLTKPGVGDAFFMLPLLVLAVFLGGQIGSRLGSKVLPAVRIRQATACLILFVSVRLWLQQI